MIGVWERWNAVREPEPYGPATNTYRMGAEWLADCELVEDWGCGRGWLRTLIDPARYRGIDGSGPMADVVADLRSYRSEVAGVFMRHVLEHNPDWSVVLDNAVASFTQKMALIVFTPLVDATHQIGWTDALRVPDIAFAKDDLAAHFDCEWRSVTVESDCQYGVETVFLLGPR